MSILAGKKTRAWLAAFAVLCVGLAVGVVFGLTTKDADAAKHRTQLKTLWAVIEEDGTPSKDKGLTGSERYPGSETEGLYRISFNRDVSRCAYTATAATRDANQISAFEDPISSHSVVVATRDSDGVEADRRFSLVVNC